MLSFFWGKNTFSKYLTILMESKRFKGEKIMIKLSFNYALAQLERKIRTGNYESHFIFENVLHMQSEYIQEMMNFYCKEKWLQPLQVTPQTLYEGYSEPLSSFSGNFYKESFSYDLLILSELETIEKENINIVRDIVVKYLGDNKIAVLISKNHFIKNLIIPERFLNEIIIC